MNEIKIKQQLTQSFGKIFDEEFIFTELFNTEYNYLVNKYHLNNYEKQILYYILNVTYPVKTDISSFHLIITMYNELKISRAIELLLTLSKNLQNINIHSIHIIYETLKNNDNINILTETMYILQFTMKLPIYMSYKTERPSFRHLFKYCNNNIHGNTIISNTDIIYDNTLSKIENINDDEFLCISRQNRSIENNVVYWNPIILTLPEDLPQNIPNTFSHDTWIFKSPMKYPVYIDMLIGKMFCDSYLNYKLTFTSYKCYNLVNDINCFHIQEDESFSENISKNPVLLEDYQDEIIYKENGNTENLYALLIQPIENFYNKQNYNSFCSHSNFIEKYVFINNKDEVNKDEINKNKSKIKNKLNKHEINKDEINKDEINKDEINKNN